MSIAIEERALESIQESPFDFTKAELVHMQNACVDFAEKEANGIYWNLSDQFAELRFRANGGVEAVKSNGVKMQFHNLEALQTFVIDNQT